MADETVTITAELRDQMSAPLQQATRRVEGFTDAVQTGARRQAAATDRSTAQITGALGRQSRLFGGMPAVVGRATTGTSRMFSTMRTSIGNTLRRITRDTTEQGERAGRGFSAGLKGAITAGLATLSVASVAALANSAVGSFAELEDSSAAASVVFGKNMDDIIAQSMTGAEKMGLSQQAVINGANTFGTYGKAAGLAGKDLSGFATGLTGLAGDMASFKGTTTEQALEAIAAGLRGEAEPLRAYGVMLDDVQMRDEALRMGLIKTTKDALTPQQKVLAAQALIFKQTKDAQGDFARTSDSTANTQKRLAAASENLSAKVGSLLAPAFTAVRTKILGAVSGMSGFIDKVAAAQKVFAAGGTNKQIGQALGLTGTALAIFDEGVGSIRAFTAAIKDGGDEITSSGVAGFFERLGVELRNAWDAGKKVMQWLWDMRTPIGIIAGLILLVLIPHWTRLGIEALKSAAKQRIAWATIQGAALKSTYVSMWGFATMIAGWVLAGTQATIQAVRIAAAWFVALGPVGWIILAVAAVVGALVWAYNNVDWFRAGVDAAFKWIGEAARNVADWMVGAWSNVVNWWNTTLMPALAAVGQWFSDVFTNIGNWFNDFIGFFVDGWGMLTDFWNGVLLPAIQAVGDFFAGIFDWIQRLIWNATTIAVFLFQRLVDFWNGVLMPALQNLGSFIGTVMNWIYTVLIKPVIDFTVGAFRSLVDFWNLTLVPALQAVGAWFGSILNWLYNTIVKPVIDFIVAAFRGLVDFWNLTLIPAFQAVGDFFQTVMDWIYNTIIKPYIDFIVGAFNGLVDFWNGVLKPIIDNVGKWFTDIIGGAISGIGDFIDDLKTGFDGFIKFWTDTLKPVVDAIATAFNTVRDAINGALDGIGKFVNNPLGGIQDILGIAKDDNGQGIMPAPNSGGGVYAGNGVRFAGGGVLGGYAPGRDSILARLSPGESVLVPELTRAIGPQKIMAANAQASGGRPAGSGPALTSGYSGQARTGAAGGSMTMVAAGAVQINITAGPGGVTDSDIDKVRAAVNAIFEEESRRGY
jgi:phage-related protein